MKSSNPTHLIFDQSRILRAGTLALVRALWLYLGMLCSLGSARAALTWNYTTANDVPVSGTSVSGTATLTLGFAPPAGTTLMVVQNNQLPFITGTFTNLAQGQPVAMTFAGVTYNFVANYFGGSGNDLVLHWAGTKAAGWGWNTRGALGDNTTTDALQPANVLNTGVLTGKTVIAVATGYYHSLALCSDGTLAAWGDGTGGALGTGAALSSPVPVLVFRDGTPLQSRTVIAIAAGIRSSLALCSDGTVVSWGTSAYGELGNGAPTGVSLVPIAVTTTGTALAGRPVVAIAMVYQSCLVLCSDGTLATWGYNGYGQLGDGTTTNRSLAVAVTTAGTPLALDSPIAISGGVEHCLALLKGGTVVAWGRNNSGQLGNGTTTNSSLALNVTTSGTVLAGNPVRAISAGGSHSMALCLDGSLATWGRNANGQLGDTTNTNSSLAIDISANGVLKTAPIVSISGGKDHSLACLSNGKLASWGSNGFGRLGVNSLTDSSTPAFVSTANLEPGARFVSGTSSGSSSHNLGLVAVGPTIASLTPSSGSVEGGTTVTITGTGFSGSAAVTFGGVPAETTIINATTLSCLTPPRAAGVVNVIVTTSLGSVTGTNLYTYVNPAPTDIMLSASSIAENNAANATVGTLTATDNVSDTNTFTLVAGVGSTDNASFTLAGNALKLTPVADFETKNSYAIRIRTTDSAGGFFEKAFTISITNVNDAPVITSNGAGAAAAISIAENTTAVTTVTATDADLPAQTLTYTKSGTDAALFNLNSSTGVLTFIAAPDFEGAHGNTYSVTVTVTDNGGTPLNDTQALTITVTNVNDAPVITSNGAGATATISIAENTTAVTTVTATDADLPAQVLTYTKSGTDAALFNLNASTGVLTFIAAPDFEGTHGNTYTLTITVTDNGVPVLNDTQAITITVTNVSEAPSISDIANQVTNEDTATSAIAFTVADPDAGTTFTLSATSSNTALIPVANIAFGGTGTNRTITLAPAANQSGTSTITVQVSDGALTASDTFVFTVNPVNDPPSFVITSPNVSATTNGLVSGPFSFLAGISFGPANEAPQNVSFTVTNSNNALFNFQPTINPLGELTFTPGSTVGVATVTVIAVDNGGTANGGNDTSASQTFTITFSNPAPTDITLSASSIAENNAANATVGTLAATDNVGDTNTFSLATGTGSTDNASFTITGNALKLTSSADFETKNSYSIRIRATDNGGGTFEKVFTISITNLNDAPVITSNGAGATASISIAENTTAVTTVTATDADLPAQTLTYTKSGTDAALFNLNSSTGVLTFIAAPDFEGAHGNTYALTVTATDNGVPVLNDTQAITITVTNVNEAPSISDMANQVTNEDIATPAIAFTVADPDAGTTFTLSATSSNPTLIPVANIAFGGTGTNRTITLTPAANLSGTSTITVQVSDGTLTATDSFVLTVTPVNDAPSFTLSTAVVTAVANSGAFPPLAIATAISPGPADEASQVVSFTVANNNNALFSVPPTIAANGNLSFTPGATPGTATVTVFAVDNGGTLNGGNNTSTQQSFVINVSNPAPTDITLSASSIPENNAANATVGTLTAADNAGDANTFTLVTGTGSTDNGSFTIVGNALKITPSANFEIKNSYAIRVRTTDSGLLFFEKAFTIAITNVNEPPTITNIPDLSANPNQTIGTTFDIADPDAGSGVSITFTSSNPTLLPVANINFIHSGGGHYLVTFTPASNQTGSSTVTAQVSDGTLTASDTFIYSINFVNQAPSFTLATDQLGTVWTPRELIHNGWRSLASSADGMKLVAGNVVGNAGNVYTSADSGVTWSSPAGSPIGVWRALASSADGTRLVGAVTPVGTALNNSLLYVSSDSGATWTPRGPDGNWVAVTSSADGSKLAAAMQNYGGSIYTSTDYGLTWTAVGPGPGYPWTAITSSADGTKLAATNFTNGIWTSVDSGATWNHQPYTPSASWTSIASSADGAMLAATMYNGYIWTSTDSGQNWTPRESVRYWRSIASSSDGTKLAAAATSGKIYTSTDAGINWTARESARDWRAIASSADGNKLAAVDFASNIYTSAPTTITPTVAACSGPASFTNVISAISPGPASEAAQTVALNVTNNNSALFLVPPSITSNGTLTFTPNNIAGNALVTVTAVDNGGTANGGVDTSAPQTFSIVVTPTLPSVISISPATGSTAGGNVVTITGSCLTGATSVSLGGTPATGVNVINATSLTCTVPAHAAGAVSVNVTTPAGTNGTNYFYTYIAPNTPPKFDLPIDEEIGNVWTPRGPVGNWKAVVTSFDNSIIAAAATNGPIYVSNDSGLTWAPNGPVGNWVSLTSSADGTKLAAVEFDGRIHTSTDSGLHWTAREYTRRWCALAASANGLKLAAVVRGGYIYTSNDAGVTWTERAATRNWIAIDSSLNGERLAAVDYLGKIYTSEDSGANWTARSDDGKWNSIVVTSDGFGIGATDEDGRFFTTFNGGVDWQEQPRVAKGSVVEGCHLLPDRPGCRRAVFIDPVGPMEISEDFGLTRRVVDTHNTWSSLAIGAKLIAAENGGRIYISNPGIANPSINAGSGAQTTPYFVRNISPGTANEAAQAVNFIVSNSNNALFITQPTISPDGTLNFTPGNTAGTAVVTVIATDNGGTDFGGNNTSNPQTFNIIITPPVVTGYAEWKALHFGSATVGTGSQDDPDADDVPNLLEYAYGLNPNSSISRQIPPIQIANGKLSVTFTEPANISGITYGAEWSPDLQNWTAIPDAGAGTNHNFSVPVSGPKKYMRLRVSEP